METWIDESANENLSEISPEKKMDGFKDEQYFIIPTESFENFAEHPLVKGLYLTDVGFFPKARNHYRERENGIEEYILIYCINGKGKIYVDNNEFQLKSHEAFCIPRRKRHRYYADKKDPWSIFWVHFKGENTAYYPLEDCQITGITSSHGEQRIVTLFDVLFRALERNYTQGNFIYISQVLSLILSEIYYREKVDEVSKQNRHMTAVIRYMYKNLNKNLTLTALAEEMQLSKSYLNAIFKKYAEKAPIDFFINLKMQEACKLFKSTDMLVAEVGRSLGYDDPYYFSRIFKKTIGVSPKEYRESDYLS